MTVIRRAVERLSKLVVGGTQGGHKSLDKSAAQVNNPYQLSDKRTRDFLSKHTHRPAKKVQGLFVLPLVGCYKLRTFCERIL